MIGPDWIICGGWNAYSNPAAADPEMMEREMSGDGKIDSRFSAVVRMNGHDIGMVLPRNIRNWEAILWRPKAKSDKHIGMFSSKRKAIRALKEAASA